MGAAPPRPHKKLFYLIQQGIEQGELRAKLTIAQQLLHILDDESISRTTGLPLEAIVQLRND
ncbi:MAG: hypothetical protein ACOYME_02425 [Prochlorotrichaceae cyanobacterium]